MQTETCNEIDFLLAQAASDRAGHRRQCGFVWLLVLIASILFGVADHLIRLRFDYPIVVLSGIFAVYVGWAIRFTVGKQSQTYRTILQRLADSRDPRALGFLLESLQYEGRETRTAVLTALAEILSALRPEDAGKLTAKAEAMLVERVTSAYHSGRKTDHPDLYVAAIKALCLVGTAGAVTPLDRLANRAPYTDIQRRIHTALTEYLPRLRARMTEVHAPQTLLRATTRSDDGLLHPSYEKPDDSMRR